MTWLQRLRRRSRREWLVAVLVLAGVAGFVGLVYVVVVVGGGALIGRTSSPDVALSVLATTVVALSFDRVQSALDHRLSRAVLGGQATPYDVLRQFSGTVAGTYAAEELPERMARLLADGTGALWAQVWLVVGERPTLAATWPPGAAPAAGRPDAEDATPGRRSLDVRHDGALLGVLVVQERDQVPLTSVEERLFAGLAGQAQLVLRGAQLRAELEQRAAQLSTRADELRLSCQRLVDAQDAGRRRLERDIHDGAQQHLVALAVNLRLAQTLAVSVPERADAVLAGQEQAAAAAIDTLAQLSRGIYPPLLADDGLLAALQAHVGNWPGVLDLSAVEVGRYSRAVEAAAYFSCLEALQNAVKHAQASRITVELVGGTDGSLSFTVTDDGLGFDPGAVLDSGGLGNMHDRVAAVGGTLTTTRRPSGGTRVRALFPAPLPAIQGL
jgi:signal transduction histidine kinase